MQIRQYCADAFTDRLFAGNQAAVCVPLRQLDEELMQNIARENNFSETAFAVRTPEGYDLRWFTPGGEIDLCGHATLAAAFVIMTIEEPGLRRVDFATKSGPLTVVKDHGFCRMNFPQAEYKEIEVTDEMAALLGVRPLKAFLGRDFMAVLESEEAVRAFSPDPEALRKLPGVCQAVTARAAADSGFDCVSRVFVPKLGVAEDPVTGSTHCMIAPYWAGELGKPDIRAFQASARTGSMTCHVRRDGRIDIDGTSVLYSSGTIVV